MAKSINKLTIANIFDDWFVFNNNTNPDIPTVIYKDKRYISILDAIVPTPIRYCVWFNKYKGCYILRLYYINHLHIDDINMLVNNYDIIRFGVANIIDADGCVDSSYIAVDISVSVDCPNGETPKVSDEPAF